MLSSRRVRKGSGRRPQSEKRQRFLWLIARGWSVYAARREVGVSRTTGANWSRGYELYRNGEVVGHDQTRTLVDSALGCTAVVPAGVA